jgi:hypothetical protein
MKIDLVQNWRDIRSRRKGKGKSKAERQDEKWRAEQKKRPKPDF